MMKPHHITLLAALLALTGAVCLGVSGQEPRAGAALGVSLIAGATTLAMYLHNQQGSPQPHRSFSGVGNA